MGTHSRVGCHRVKEGGGFFAEHGYLEAPSLVQWMATLRCGLRCEHCLTVSRESGFSDMPLEKARGLIDEITGMGVREFLVTGGEPLVREDLGEVVEYLGRKGVSWTLNTAAMPGQDLRAVLSQHKPGFVAVSLDGPREVHDAFRGRAGAWDEAMESIRFFKSLGGVRVCAGTTVTSRNYDSLDETFHLVTAGGADQWGIHLLVPEGRAGDRPDLFLSKTQLKRLIEFVARRRRHFPVQMADEIGYLGYLEPLVRDFPLNCGAGRAQCVVLPDGEIVPCTTLDRSCSAGSLYERPLSEIWKDGFEDLRAWRPSGKCGSCDYAVACKGGCWLQRKAGTQCFKEVWHVPGALKTAAGIAVCLGGLAAGQDARASVRAEGAVEQPVSVVRTGNSPSIAIAQSSALDGAIDEWYFKQAAGLAWVLPSTGADWNDAGWKFFRSFAEGTLPSDIPDRCAQAIGALETRERSLSLIALLWWAVSERSLETDGTKRDYTPAERQAIRNALAAIESAAQVWRLEIFVRDLDPYLSRGRTTDLPHSFMTKAGPKRGDRERHALSKDLNEERWGVGAHPDTDEAAVAYLLEHHYGEQMNLSVGFGTPGTFLRYAGGGNEVVSSPVGATGADVHRLGLFDVIEPGASVTLSFQVKGHLRTAPAYEYGQESLLNDQGREQDLDVTVLVSLAGGREYTYVELLDAVYLQNRPTLLSIAYDWLQANTVSVWNQDAFVVAAVHENGALLWPAMQEIRESDSIIPAGRVRADGRMFSPAEIAEIQRRAGLKDIDFRMF